MRQGASRRLASVTQDVVDRTAHHGRNDQGLTNVSARDFFKPESNEADPAKADPA